MTNFSIQKTVALVLALAKLHNYCIDCSDTCNQTLTAADEWHQEMNGAVPPLVVAPRSQAAGNNNIAVPEQLMHVAHHSNDIGGTRGRSDRQRRYNNAYGGEPLLVIACTRRLWTAT